MGQLFPGQPTPPKLTVTLDKLALNLSLNSNESQSQVVQQNLAVQSAQIRTGDSRGVQFTSFSGSTGNFVADRIQLNTSADGINVQPGFVPEALVYIRFPEPASRLNPTNVSLGFVLYKSDRFFRSQLYSRTSQENRASIRVLSASVVGQERTVVPQHVELEFRPDLNDAFLHDFACVFWDYGLQDWSTAGCSKGNASDGVLRCFCNHTTNFAALWSFRTKYNYAVALDIFSKVGLSFSIAGLVVSIIHHVRENFLIGRQRQTNINAPLALLCIYVSLLAFIVIFLAGARNHQDPVRTVPTENRIPALDHHVDPDGGACTAVAALLHFFLLATFAWNATYATQLVLLVRSMRRSLPPYWTSLSLVVGWGMTSP
ncbi:adhesion G-protein coupled receptor G7-like [Cololabis saira]|uniref:adhesion G-protein coupled receptor G7-like n=1 Tax=Cololabis saira TaxID=129043 RepID=UPI002AD2D297|nr:adhesion G-protein coupled receptor G7-like [Cololabis saira]